MKSAPSNDHDDDDGVAKKVQLAIGLNYDDKRRSKFEDEIFRNLNPERFDPGAVDRRPNHTINRPRKIYIFIVFGGKKEKQFGSVSINNNSNNLRLKYSLKIRHCTVDPPWSTFLRT